LRNFATLTRMRMQLAMRNRMFFFFSVVFPLGMFFLYAGVFAKGHPRLVSYFLGPVIAFNVMGSFWGLSAALVTFREQGILRRFHIAPVSAVDMLASSVLANFVLTVPTVCVELIMARVIFHVSGFGDLVSLAIFVAVGTVAFGCLGLVVASVTNTMQETQVINQLIWLPLIFLSGATLPVPYLPKVAQRVALFLPATYLVSALQSALYLSLPFWKLLIQLCSLLIWAVLTLFVATQLFRWEPEARIPRRGKLMAILTALPFFLLGVWEYGNGKILPQAQATFRSLDSPDNDQTKPNPQPQEKNSPF
jgi:ABC-2 type transport system permease protein